MCAEGVEGIDDGRGAHRSPSEDRVAEQEAAMDDVENDIEWEDGVVADAAEDGGMGILRSGPTTPDLSNMEDGDEGEQVIRHSEGRLDPLARLSEPCRAVSP